MIKSCVFLKKGGVNRVEFSKSNIEITKASKPRSFKASVGYIVIIFVIVIIMFLIILPIFFNNIFFFILVAFLYSKKSKKIEKKIILGRSICTTMQNVKIMKKCSKNSVFFTIRVSEFGALIFGRSNGPNISGFRIIRISGLQH